MKDRSIVGAFVIFVFLFSFFPYQVRAQAKPFDADFLKNNPTSENPTSEKPHFEGKYAFENADEILEGLGETIAENHAHNIKQYQVEVSRNDQIIDDIIQKLEDQLKNKNKENNVQGPSEEKSFEFDQHVEIPEPVEVPFKNEITLESLFDEADEGTITDAEAFTLYMNIFLSSLVAHGDSTIKESMRDKLEELEQLDPPVSEFVIIEELTYLIDDLNPGALAYIRDTNQKYISGDILYENDNLYTLYSTKHDQPNWFYHFMVLILDYVP